MKDSRAKGGFSHISAVGRNAPAGLISLSLVIVISNERALGILYNLYRLGSFFFFFFVFSLDFLVVSIIVAIAMDNLQGCCHHGMNNSLDWSKGNIHSRSHHVRLAVWMFFYQSRFWRQGKKKYKMNHQLLTQLKGLNLGSRRSKQVSSEFFSFFFLSSD